MKRKWIRNGLGMSQLWEEPKKVAMMLALVIDDRPFLLGALSLSDGRMHSASWHGQTQRATG